MQPTPDLTRDTEQTRRDLYDLVVRMQFSPIPWLESQLVQTPPGFATVVFHSIVRLYFSEEARNRLDEILAPAKERATREAPLAWLSMEPGERETDVDLTIWPGGERKRIAEAGFHGRNVRIL